MKLAIIGFFAVCIGGWTIIDQYVKHTTFQRVNGHVSAVTDQCYLEKVERGTLSKTTLTSDLIRCDVAETLTREHPKWYGYTIKHKIEVRFVYISPVDGKTYNSSLKMTDYPNGKPLRLGDVIPVLASKTSAGKTRQV
jgi:hypothetical protein